MLAINSMPDHLHLFFGLRPNQSISDLMRIVKSESSEWINSQKFNPETFRWQEGMAHFHIHVRRYKRFAITFQIKKNTIKRKRLQKNMKIF